MKFGLHTGRRQPKNTRGGGASACGSADSVHDDDKNAEPIA